MAAEVINYLRKIFKFTDLQLDRQLGEMVSATNEHLDATAAHGATTEVVGTTNSQTLTNKKFGTPPDYSEFEEDGTLVARGAATYYTDIQFNMTPKATGAGHPTLAAWNTDFEEWSYAVGDHSNAESQEAPHWWKEGSAVSFHVHFSTGTGNYVNGDKVQFQLKVSAADSKTAAPFTQFPAAQVLTGEIAFTGTVAPFSSVLLPFSAFTLPAAMTTIGAQIKVRLERIAKSAGGTNPGTAPFVLQVGCHAEGDTFGSRGVYTK